VMGAIKYRIINPIKWNADLREFSGSETDLIPTSWN